MSFGDSVLVSCFGIGTVFLMLLALLVAIMVISWIVRRIVGSKGKKPVPEQNVQEKTNEGLEKAKLMACLMAVLGEETGTDPQNLKIKSIREIDG